MTDNIKELLDRARQLPEADRQELAERILDTLEPDPDVEAAWAEEAHTRWNKHVASGAPAIDAFAAIEDARALLKKRRGA